MAKYIELEKGQRFGSLTVIEQKESDKFQASRYLCKCDCGGEIIAMGSRLKRGITTNCGHNHRHSKIIGKRFGKLVVESFAGPNKNGTSVYLCKCDCGQYAQVRVQSLTSGNTQSCGCSRKQEHFHDDLEGKKFGMVTVLEYSHQNEARQAMFKCKCDCGNEFVARGVSVKSGNTKSCGCLRDKGVKEYWEKKRLEKEEAHVQG